MAVFLILMAFCGSLPCSDFKVFQTMQECKEFKAKIAENLEKYGITPLYLECKSAPAEEKQASE